MSQRNNAHPLNGILTSGNVPGFQGRKHRETSFLVIYYRRFVDSCVLRLNAGRNHFFFCYRHPFWRVLNVDFNELCFAFGFLFEPTSTTATPVVYEEAETLKGGDVKNPATQKIYTAARSLARRNTRFLLLPATKA